MVSRSQKVRLGIFITIAMTILLVSIAIITGNKLLRRQVTYYIRYKDLSMTGLEVGSAVRYRGIRIGRIEDIYIDEKDITSIIVKITVNPNVPIKEDTKAIVTYISFATGVKMVELMGGTNESKRLSPNSFIIAGVTLVDTIGDRAEIMAQKMEIILNNLAELTQADKREQLFRLIENTSNTLKSFNNLMTTNQGNIFQTINNIEHLTTRLDTFITVTNFTLKDIRKITNSPKLLATLDHIESVSADLEKAKLSELIAKLSKTVEQTEQTFTHLDLTLLKSRHDILSSTEILRESLEYFNEFTRIISENPSLLLRSTPQKEITE